MNKIQSWNSRIGQSSGRDSILMLIIRQPFQYKWGTIDSNRRMRMSVESRACHLGLQVWKGFYRTHKEQRVYSMYKEQQIGEMTKLFALIKLFERTFVEIFSFWKGELVGSLITACIPIPNKFKMLVL